MMIPHRLTESLNNEFNTTGRDCCRTASEDGRIQMMAKVVGDKGFEPLTSRV